MRELVSTAKSVVPVEQIDAQVVEQEDAARRDALNNLYAWYREWTEVARASIKRRDYLIRLGLASRRSSSDGKDTDAPDTGAGPQPVEA